MKVFIVIVVLFLIVPASVWAQETDHHPRGLGYVFIGAGTHQMGLTTGFGGEGYFYKGLGMGAELEAAGIGASTNDNSNLVGIGSADLSYHFFPKKIRGAAAPFVEGGYSNFFGQDVFLHYPGYRSYGNYQHGFNIGGGIDIFATKHLGVRFDVRYNGHGGRILWASFPNEAQLSFVAIRIGLTLR
jgi:hypothetical protein